VVGEVYWREDKHPFDDDDLFHLALIMEDFGIYNAKDPIDNAVRIKAREKKFHPIKDKLEALVWDGVPRVAKALHHFLGCEENELTYEALKLFMFGALERIYRPGCKFEIMLCLVGGQGGGKSTFFRFLALDDEWFTDDLRRLDDENVVRKMIGHWIIEMPEMLATTSAKYIEENKAFVSRQKDTYKVPYAKHPKDYPRQCVFGGTSNKKTCLPFDRTGNRRFIPIETHTELAEVHINENVMESRKYFEQMWAEIMTEYVPGNCELRLSKELEKQLEQVRNNFMVEDNDAGLIQSYLDELKTDYVCTGKIYQDALGNAGKPKRHESNDIADIMNNTIAGWKHGGTATKRFVGFGVQKYWYRDGVNQQALDPQKDADGFVPVTEQMELPFR
jgi:predicted P-loop ATPase